MSSTVIVGAGIIGTSTAYYLSQYQTKEDAIHLVEASPEIFASASGHGGGFIARDWYSPALTKLGELSFDLHKQLAEEHDGCKKWGYSPTTAISLAESVGNHGGLDWLLEGTSRSSAVSTSAQNNGHAPAWLAHKGEIDVLSDGATTAQIDPRRLCEFLLAASLSRNVHLHQPAHPLSITRSPSGALSSLTLHNPSTQPPTTTTIPCTKLILAAGAWTPHVYRTLFPASKLTIPITPLAGHSLTLRSPHWPPPTSTTTGNELNPTPTPPCHAIFTTTPLFSPEIFARNTHPPLLYLAGLNSPPETHPLPPLPHLRATSPPALATLRATAARLLGDGARVVGENVCWRPVARGGVPVVGVVGGGADEGGEDVIVAAGHGPWGISLGLGTGWCVCEMGRRGRGGSDVEAWIGGGLGLGGR